MTFRRFKQMIRDWFIGLPTCAECGVKMKPAGDCCYACPNCGAKSGSS